MNRRSALPPIFAIMFCIGVQLPRLADGQQSRATSQDRFANASRLSVNAARSVDHRKSRVFVFVPKKGVVGHDHAVVGFLKKGEITLGAQQNAGRFEFDMMSFSADTKDSRRALSLEGETDDATQEKVNDNMRGVDVLNVAKYPTATFVIRSAAAAPVKGDPAEGQPFELEGDFTLHGITRQLKFAIVAKETGGQLRLSGKFPLRQTDFKIKPFSKVLGTIGVADELTVYGDIWLAPPDLPR